MLIDFHASEAQYADHLLPIWRALDASVRGKFFHMGRLRDYMLSIGVDAADLEHGRPHVRDGLIVVASWQDLLMARHRPAVMVNHGAGQRYAGDAAAANHGSYSGGEGRETVVLNICPSERDAAVCRAAQPGVPAVAVGCPKLDSLHAHAATGDGERTGISTSRERRRVGPVTVAVSFHFPLKLCPESFWAFPHYEKALIDLAADSERGFELIGHGHPRAFEKLRRFYRQISVEPVQRFAEVCERADVYVCDNSSTIFEFASLDRPVVVLNAPWYRRDVEHGLRFWEAADVGVQCDEPADLRAAISLAIEDPPYIAEVRRRIVDGIYAHRDGKAALRAAAAIGDVAAQNPQTGRRMALDGKRARQHARG